MNDPITKHEKTPKNEDNKNNGDTNTTTKNDWVTVEFYDDIIDNNNNNNNDDDTTTIPPITSIRVPSGTRLTDAATQAGIIIPTLCHHPRLLPPVGQCGLCVVAIEGGPTPTQLACSTLCRNSSNQDDDNTNNNHDQNILRVHVHGTVLNGLANAALQRSLRNQQQSHQHPHNHHFAPGGIVELEDLGHWMRNQLVDESSRAIVYDPSLCIGCTRCVRACDKLQGMQVLEIPSTTFTSTTPPPCIMSTRAGRKLRDTECISCGQCTVFCPTGESYKNYYQLPLPTK